VLLLNQSEIVIAQAKIQSEFTIDVDAVLNVTGMGVFKVLRLVLPWRCEPPSGVTSDEVIRDY